MASVHSKNLEIYNAANFINSLGLNPTSNIYFTFGRTIPWSSESIVAYTEDDIQNWYDAIQSPGAAEVPAQRTVQQLNISKYLTSLNNGILSADDVKNSIVNEPFTQNVVYPVVREFLGTLQRQPDDEKFGYWVEQLAKNLVKIKETNETEDFIKYNYVKFLGSEPDKQTLDFYTDQLTRNLTTREQFIKDILSGNDYYILNNTASKFVTSLYLNLYNRAPGSADLNHWIGVLNSGGGVAVNRKNIVDLFFDSAEFKRPNIYNFVLNGLSPALNDSDFILRTFRTFLQRVPTNGELGTYVSRLASGELRIDIVREILKSNEYSILYPNDLTFVTSIYYNLLTRMPDTEGLATYIDMYDGGAGKSQVVDSFLNSNEFLTDGEIWSPDRYLVLGYAIDFFPDTLTKYFSYSREFIDKFGEDASRKATTSFITRLFKDILRREPTTNELTLYSDGTWSIGRFINDVINSLEYYNFTKDSIRSYLIDKANIVQLPVTTQAASEIRPPSPTTSIEEYNIFWQNLIGGKKITGNDVSFCIPRHNWVPGTVYAQYDDRLDSNQLTSINNKFYVVTDDFNVYKCLYNNNGGVSFDKPTLTLTNDSFQTADKYIWKYMYSISSQDQLKFTTAEFMPVKTLKIKDGSTQWEVQNNAIANAGSLYVCQLTSPGTGYTSDDIYVSIVGNGFSANAFAVRDTANSTISEIIIDNGGYGYTRANVFIISANNTGVGATARAIISPPGGHGSDPVTELGASYVMVSVSLNGTESNKFSVANDFRQIAIIQDPIRRGGSNSFSNLTFSQTTTAVVSGESVNYEKDEYVYQGNSFRFSTFRGIVFDWNPASNQLKLIGTDGSPTNEKITGYVTGATRTLLSISVQPDLQYNTGKLLYIDNIQPIQRDASQSEEFKIVLKF